VCKHLKAELDSVCDDDNDDDDDDEEVENATPGTAVHYESAQCHPLFSLKRRFSFDAKVNSKYESGFKFEKWL
jgi:hypothetical protein